MAALTFGLLTLISGDTAVDAATAGRVVPSTAARPPVLAYYYIWFEARSWSRAKQDYPLIGRYASDDVEVMRQHVRWAKQAGIDGFIVSWRHTEVLDARLARLVAIATEEHFELAIVYQGLDFSRNPRPVDTVRADIERFADLYGKHPVFQLFGRPLVIVSGTDAYSRDEIGRIASSADGRLHLLASAKSVAGYERVDDLVDGDAYYWSSVNPATFSRYEEKLASMGQAVHDRDGLWIAPAAPGFDSRLLGGSTVVDRRNGATLREELAAALSSGADAIGFISWNEFSENTHVEPSEDYGMRYLEVLGDALGGTAIEGPPGGAGAPADRVLDDSDSAPGAMAYWGGLRALAGFTALLVVIVVAVIRSHRRRPRKGEGVGPRSG